MGHYYDIDLFWYYPRLCNDCGNLPCYGFKGDFRSMRILPVFDNDIKIGYMAAFENIKEAVNFTCCDLEEHQNAGYINSGKLMWIYPCIFDSEEEAKDILSHL